MQGTPWHADGATHPASAGAEAAGSGAAGGADAGSGEASQGSSGTQTCEQNDSGSSKHLEREHSLHQASRGHLGQPNAALAARLTGHRSALR